jgi:uncharacterized protein YbjQ (UPF0145 family)
MVQWMQKVQRVRHQLGQKARQEQMTEEQRKAGQQAMYQMATMANQLGMKAQAKFQRNRSCRQEASDRWCHRPERTRLGWET